MSTPWFGDNRISRFAQRRPIVSAAIAGTAAWFVGAELLVAAAIGGAVTWIARKAPPTDASKP